MCLVQINFIGFQILTNTSKQSNLQNYISKIQMINHKHHPIILYIIVILAVSCTSQNIIDFTYSEYVKNSPQSIDKSYNIKISPNQDLFRGYAFPKACFWSRNLKIDDITMDKQLSKVDEDDYVNNLRQGFTDLLKISEKIKYKKNNLQQINQIGGFSSSNLVSLISDPELEDLHSQEERLKEIANQITEKTQMLDNLVRQSLENSDSNDFIKSSLQFQIESLKLKRDYLSNLLKNSEAHSKSSIDTDYEKYFNDLRRKFNEENQLISDLDVILANYNEIGELKEKISSLQNKIDIANVMLEQKRACADQIKQIKKLQKNHNDIKTLMTNLREKKKDSSNVNNKYCEGVTKKLQNRLRNVLLSYDYTFQCAEGKDKLQEQIRRDQLALDQAKRRLKELENNAGIDDYKNKFEKNRAYIKSKYQEISSFKIDPYHHDPNDLRALIKKTQEQLANALKQKQNLNAPSQKGVIDFQKIHELVTSIKKLKGNYCKQYDQYEKYNNQLTGRLHKYQAKLQYDSKLLDLHLQETKEIEQLQRQFQELRQKLQEAII